MSESLAEGLPRMQAQVREYVSIYEGLPGNAGMFGALLMKDALRRAEIAASSGDIVAMLQSFHELSEFKL